MAQYGHRVVYTEDPFRDIRVGALSGREGHAGGGGGVDQSMMLNG
jgi:hypothetical protein